MYLISISQIDNLHPCPRHDNILMLILIRILPGQVDNIGLLLRLLLPSIKPVQIVPRKQVDRVRPDPVLLILSPILRDYLANVTLEDVHQPCAVRAQQQRASHGVRGRRTNRLLELIDLLDRDSAVKCRVRTQHAPRIDHDGRRPSAGGSKLANAAS